MALYWTPFRYRIQWSVLSPAQETQYYSSLRIGTPLTQARIRMPEYRQRALILDDPGLLCFKKVALIFSRSTVPYYYLCLICRNDSTPTSPLFSIIVGIYNHLLTMGCSVLSSIDLDTQRQHNVQLSYGKRILNPKSRPLHLQDRSDLIIWSRGDLPFLNVV